MVFNPKNLISQLQTDRSSSNYQNPSNVTRRTTSYNAPVIKSGAKAVTAAVGRYKERGTTTVLKFPKEDIKYFTLLEYAKYSRLGPGGSVGTGALLNVAFQTQGSIALPMPVSGLVDRQEIKYTEFDLGGSSQAVKAGLISTLVSGLSPEAINKSFIEGSYGDLALQAGRAYGAAVPSAAAKFGSNVAKDPAGTAGQVVGGLAEAAGSAVLQQAGQTVQALAGIVPNSFVTLLFKGPSYKRHRLAFKLLPSNFDESIIIRDIVMKINNLAAPGLSSNGFLYDFPYLVYPSFRPNADYSFKFKPCVITAVETDFAPSRIPAFYTSRLKQNANPPEAVTITIELTEIEFWLRNQFDDSLGYNPNVVGNTHRDPARAAKVDVAKTPLEGGPSYRGRGGLR